MERKIIVGYEGCDPAERLLEQAEAGADLLVAGSRGYGVLGQVLIGSVSAKLVDGCPVPVLIIPRGASRELTAERHEATRNEVRTAESAT